MYRRPKFLEILLQIRREMAVEVDYDVDLFAEVVRSGVNSPIENKRELKRGNRAEELTARINPANGVLP